MSIVHVHQYLDSVLVNSGKEYYPQIFLEECKYAIKKKKKVNTINEDLELNESDESDDESDKEIIIPFFKKFLWI